MYSDAIWLIRKAAAGYECAKVEDAVNVGDVVRVKVLDVNTEAKRISLSIREVLEDEALVDVPVEDEYAIADETLIEE